MDGLSAGMHEADIEGVRPSVSRRNCCAPCACRECYGVGLEGRLMESGRQRADAGQAEAWGGSPITANRSPDRISASSRSLFGHASRVIERENETRELLPLPSAAMTSLRGVVGSTAPT